MQGDVMQKLTGHVVVKGFGSGHALVTQLPINFSAALAGVSSIIPGKRGVIQDRHHELYQKNIKDKVLVFPTCIGSTFTGMVLMQLMYKREAPAAIITQNADSLLVSGVILAEVWFNCGIPLVEYRGKDIYDKIHTGDTVAVDGDTGEIMIY
jgi:predicted aconitase with swiveling domain